MTKTNIRYIVNDIDAAIEFYTSLLGFTVQMHPAPGFAALEKDGLQLLLNQPGAGGAGESMPDGETPIPCMLHLYVHDVDAVYEQAVKAGGELLREPKNEFYGDRSAGVKDDWGNTWWLATRVEEVSGEEMKRREKELRE